MMRDFQLDLFSSVLHAYSAERGGILPNAVLYQDVARHARLPSDVLEKRHPVGIDGSPRNLFARKVRWYQQSLKQAGILEHVPGERGVWRLTQPAGKDLSKIQPGVSVVAFSTDLGIAILGSCDTVFAAIDAPIALTITSPPYPLSNARRYGNPTEPEYVDWICRMLEPVVRHLMPGGSVVLNVSNDIFEPGLPSRSIYRERLILALHDRLGLHKMDELIWHNPSKPPGPVAWASKTRQQLNVAWEPVYWLTNDPRAVRSNNRRVLQDHAERHLKLIDAGGERRNVANSDGAYRISPGSYGGATEGRIPRNVLRFGHACIDQRNYKAAARSSGLPAHGAAMPLSLASFLIEFMSKPGDLVVDPFGGSFTTAKAAESLGRRWLSTEIMAEYVLGAATRFSGTPGFECRLAA